MSIPLTYKDTIQLVKPTLGSDGYGTEFAGEIASVSALFIENTGWQHGGYQSQITSDAEVYIDPDNTFVKENFNRLEGMMVVANRYGNVSSSQQWYRITSVIIGEDKLLGNSIDNINCQLKKTSEIEDAS